MDRVDKEVPVLVPLGSIEQHGLHLPLITDTLQVDHIADRVHAELQEHVIVLPTLWLGSSDHHLDFSGTISVPPSLLTEMVRAIGTSILAAGFRRIFFLNGHGGNEVPAAQALTELAVQDDRARSSLLTLASWWAVGKPNAAALGMQTSSISHACEYETSLVMHLRPDLVDHDQARDTVPVIGSVWLDGEKRVQLFRRFSVMTGSGSLGRPIAASPQKGEAIINSVVADVVAFLREFTAWPLPTSQRPAEISP